LISIGTTLIFAGVCVALALAAFFFLTYKRDQLLARTFPQRAERLIIRKGGSVFAYHPEAREIGEAILRSGGNAFDAFVATTAAENVLAEGVSSLAGPLGVLIFRAEDGQVVYMDADFDDPLDPSGRRSVNDSRPGATVLVPGTPAGLEALATRYGRLPFAELLQPAIALAADGFPVNRMMAGLIARFEKLLKKSEYGHNTFFRNGRALEVGEIIQQPEVADFLYRLGKEGSAYVYNGDWRDRFLSVVASSGGRLTAKDLGEYSVKWSVPWTTTYRGCTIHSSSGQSYGGLWVLLALKTLEHTTLPATPRYWEDADTLEQMIRISRQVWSEPDIFDHHLLGDSEIIQPLLTADYARSIWERVRSKSASNFMGVAGSHSYHIIVTDDEGNIANGTTTIQSDPWAQGIFVQGIPLTSGGGIPWRTEPGKRRLSPLSIHLVFQDGRPRFAVGSFSNSVVEASFQFLVKLIDYQMPALDVVSTPRFGTFPNRGNLLKLSLKLDRNWLDPRVESEIVKTLKARGIKVEHKGPVDTGLGVVVCIEPGGEIEGSIAPIPYLSNPFKSSAW
jgi:gamma-glutamyltranspeptidase/glutathione hydrolase